MGVAQLLSDQPALHGSITHGLVPEALYLIEREVNASSRTLETGAGFSTVTFAATGADHVCIVPDPAEVESIRRYCEDAGVSLDRVTFHVEASEWVLPTLDTGPLSFVLLDGSHSFPQVFLDWFYVAEALAIGGVLLVDDVHVWTGAILRDFLRAEPGWEQVTELRGRAAVFRKTGPTELGRVWYDQPYVAAKTGFGRLPNKARQAVSMVRHGQARELLRAVRHSRTTKAPGATTAPGG